MTTGREKMYSYCVLLNSEQCLPFITLGLCESLSNVKAKSPKVQI